MYLQYTVVTWYDVKYGPTLLPFNYSIHTLCKISVPHDVIYIHVYGPRYFIAY